MTAALEKFFSERKIEYFATLSYTDCREIAGNIMEREDFSPRSVIIFLLPYFVSYGENISAYATSLDYHILIKEVTGEVCRLLSELRPDSHSRGYGDHSPIDERHAAAISGLGVIGDNGLLINEKYGSYVFAADVITDIPPEEIGAISPLSPGECLHCGACRSACPTGILRKEGNDCLSAITQRKGELAEDEERLILGCNTAWGCDVCQRVCPYNKDPIPTPVDFFYRDRVARLTPELLGAMDKPALRARAFGWRGRAVVERNLRILENSIKQ